MTDYKWEPICKELEREKVPGLTVTVEDDYIYVEWNRQCVESNEDGWFNHFLGFMHIVWAMEKAGIAFFSRTYVFQGGPTWQAHKDGADIAHAHSLEHDGDEAATGLTCVLKALEARQ